MSFVNSKRSIDEAGDMVEECMLYLIFCSSLALTSIRLGYDISRRRRARSVPGHLRVLSLRGIAVDVGGTSTEAVGKEKGGIFHVLCRQGGTGLRQHDDGQCVCLRDHLLWRYGLGVWR